MVPISRVYTPPPSKTQMLLSLSCQRLRQLYTRGTAMASLIDTTLSPQSLTHSTSGVWVSRHHSRAPASEWAGHRQLHPSWHSLLRRGQCSEPWWARQSSQPPAYREINSKHVAKLKNLLMPLFLMGCFPVDVQVAKRSLRKKSVKRPIKVGKRPINEGGTGPLRPWCWLAFQSAA